MYICTHQDYMRPQKTEFWGTRFPLELRQIWREIRPVGNSASQPGLHGELTCHLTLFFNIRLWFPEVKYSSYATQRPHTNNSWPKSLLIAKNKQPLGRTKQIVWLRHMATVLSRSVSTIIVLEFSLCCPLGKTTLLLCCPLGCILVRVATHEKRCYAAQNDGQTDLISHGFCNTHGDTCIGTAT